MAAASSITNKSHYANNLGSFGKINETYCFVLIIDICTIESIWFLFESLLLFSTVDLILNTL